MKPEQDIYEKIHAVMVDCLECSDDPAQVAAGLAVLYICLCKDQDLGASEAVSIMLRMWADVGEDFEQILNLPYVDEEEKVFN